MVPTSHRREQHAPEQRNDDSVREPPAQVLLASVVHLSEAMHGVRTRVAGVSGFIPTIIAYPGYGSTTWVRVLARVVLTSEPAAARGKVRGWRAFTSVPVRHSEVEVEIGGVIHPVRADDGGLVDVVLQVHLAPGWHPVVLRSPGTAPAQAQVLIVAPDATFGIVSDIDDTVMVTALPRPLLALWNTLVLSERARTPTPGMAVLLDRIVARHPGAPVLYLSTGPWNVAPALARFLARNLYPKGILLLTDWGPTRQRWFRSGREHKRNNLERLAREFPGVQWLLVGDDGQHDPEIYADFARAHAGQTAAIAIRQLSAGEALLAGRRAHEDSPATEHGPVPWATAPDGAGMAAQLGNYGLL
ncbi:ACP synthase [Arthrobacter livingstonensis]|uniref:ACP synthase n=1 Tax=Arthrobacter livingstonensis TaxID=670078 RepID=A0A2V5KZV3_9MICC|nr:phosphatase domain-containing protein [Arthrobacter livingstonensis]PYI64198.1 ACP synthase [Arthrobacter livingstonensis]